MSAKERWDVLVTGAGRGIGLALAERLARAGHRVTGTVRDAARAEALGASARAAGLDIAYRRLELTEPAGIAALAARVVAEGGVDVLVNNAGCGVFGAVEDVDDERASWQFEANLLGPLVLTRALLPCLRERRGRILWIGSLAGRIALPFQAHYSATKAAVASISDAMRLELRGTGVEVVCVEPGDVATGFPDARQVAPDAADGPYARRHARCLAAVERQERGAAGPEGVARAIESLLARRRLPARYPVGPGSGVLCGLLRVVPDRLREAFVARRYRV